MDKIAALRKLAAKTTTSMKGWREYSGYGISPDGRTYFNSPAPQSAESKVHSPAAPSRPAAPKMTREEWLRMGQEMGWGGTSTNSPAKPSGDISLRNLWNSIKDGDRWQDPGYSNPLPGSRSKRLIPEIEVNDMLHRWYMPTPKHPSVPYMPSDMLWRKEYNDDSKIRNLGMGFNAGVSR